MNKTIYKHCRLALLALLVPSMAGAVGLGKLTVRSLLGQPLNAEVDLVSVQNDELATLSARPASLDAFGQANRQYSALVAGLHFSIEKRTDGQPYIKVTSEQTVSDPFVDLLLELNWASGRLVREYTLLIDPPNYAQAQPLAPVPTLAPQTRAVPVPLPPAEVVMPPTTKPNAGSDYGPIKRGETLSRIAARVKPEGVTLAQMLVGIFRNNPDAFMNNNMNRLKADRMLRIPNMEQLMALSQAEAVREVRGQVTEQSKVRRKLPASPRGKDKSADGKPVLRLSGGEPSGGAKGRNNSDRVQALEDELVARERLLNESSQRIKELKKAVN